MAESKEPSGKLCLVGLEAIFSNCLLLYFLEKADWDFFLKAAAFINLQLPMFIFWEIIHIIVKRVFKND